MRNQQNRQGRQGGQQNQQGEKRPPGQQGLDPQRDRQGTGGSQQRGGGQSQQKDRGQQAQKNVHGEGNYAASKQYNDATREFAQSGRVEEAAKAAEPRSDADALQMQAAEAEGKRHSKGEDPALNRKSSELAPDASRAPKPGEQE